MHRSSRSKLAGAALAAAAAFVASPEPAHAGNPGFMRFWPPSRYCADGNDLNGYWATQHIAAGGNQLYVMGCAEAIGGAAVYRYDFPRQRFVDLHLTAQYVAASPSGHAFAVKEYLGTIHFFDGSTWQPRSDLPGGVKAYNVAAASDAVVYVLGDEPSPGACPGGLGTCIWQSWNGGASWSLVASDWDGTMGAIAIAVDPVGGKLWSVTSSGHVWSLEYIGAPYDITYWQDRTATGLPSAGAVAISVYNGYPWVLGNLYPGRADAQPGDPVYSLYNGVWNRWPTVGGLVTDLTRDTSTGRPWAVQYNGPSEPGTNNNVLLFTDDAPGY